ncbi:MAG: 3-phosphoshikimate 1-carboxyvinyltransferase [Saprospiraceae bacterium]|nr:3-phosphoshikimate 1-carboxyvinyltransferase [Saprospiraceae bacterium]
MFHIHHTSRRLQGVVALDGSKSISNRALIILALAGVDPSRYLSRLSTSKDTVTLQRLLGQSELVFDAGDAGTTFRFMAAYLALQPGVKILTGSARMQERPCGPLVDALRELGADISYLGKEGYPPLQIGAFQSNGVDTVRVPAGVSSQFLSALLLIAPYLPQGLTLVPDGPLVSRPYLEMTLSQMRHFGADVQWQGDAVLVRPGTYQAREMVVEADWSGASYWYAMAALAEEVELKLEGLFVSSWQGDSKLVPMMERFGVETTFEASGVVLKKSGRALPPYFEQDFLECPDIAQTLAVVCAGSGVEALFSGLETLSIKETDRIAALKTELAKVGVSFSKLPARMHSRNPGKTIYHLQGKATWTETPQFSTYGDHRMAMAFAALGLLGTIKIENPEVVVKSYTRFWEDLKQLGFSIE